MNFFSKLLLALKKRLVIPIISVVALLAIAGVVTYEITKAEVTVAANDEITQVSTHADTVNDLLTELGIEVKEHDELSHDKDDPITSNMKINYTKAKQIIVSTDGEKQQEYYSTAETVGDFLNESNIDLNEHDKVSLGNDAEIKDGLTITIEKAYQVLVNDGGDETKVWTTGGTVGDLLESENIELGELDRLKPKTTANLSKDTAITITRVEKVTDIVESTIDYSVVTKNDSSLEKGSKKVVEQGEEGLVAKHYEVTLENGEEVSRKLVKEEVEKESKQRVVAVGTKVIQNKGTSTVSRGDGKVAETLYMHATAYNWNCPTCSGSGKTATGYNLKANPSGVIAVDPSVIPLGTKVWVEGYGYAVARDTGGNIKGNRIDVHMPSQAAALRFGTKNVKVKILK